MHPGSDSSVHGEARHILQYQIHTPAEESAPQCHWTHNTAGNLISPDVGAKTAPLMSKLAGNLYFYTVDVRCRTLVTDKCRHKRTCLARRRR